MLISVAAVIAGLLLLIWSADRFVEGAAACARLLGVSTLIIGIIVVGFGTSAPEIGVSVMAALAGTPNLAIGNALGSNIANIGLILGVTAILAPIPVESRLLKTEYPLLLLATAVMGWALFDLRLNWIDGSILLLLLSSILYFLVQQHRRHADEYAHFDQDTAIMTEAEIPKDLTLAGAVGWILLGLILLVGSSKMLVWGASNIALAFGVSNLVIGLTIVALGTSLPELAASIASLKKDVPDVAIGNVIGSNLFNSLAVIGLPAVITPFAFEAAARSRDLTVVIVLTVVLILMSRFPSVLPRFLTRAKGVFLFSAFVLYQLYLYYEIAAA